MGTGALGKPHQSLGFDSQQNIQIEAGALGNPQFSFSIMDFQFLANAIKNSYGLGWVCMLKCCILCSQGTDAIYKVAYLWCLFLES
jgi:hypothetical protein